MPIAPPEVVASARGEAPSQTPRNNIPVATIAPDVESYQPVEGTVVHDPAQDGFHVLDTCVKQYTAVTCGSRVYLKVQKRVSRDPDSHLFAVQDLYTEEVSGLRMYPLHGTRLDVVRADLEMLKKFHHKSVLACHDHFVFKLKNASFFCVQSELCEKGSLHSMVDKKLKKKENFTSSFISDVLYQIASGLAYIHDQGHLHGDLTLENVLMTHDNQVKLCGFGLPTIRRTLHSALTITGGSHLYAPPEWVDSSILSRNLTALEAPLPSYDLWSVGCILSELATMTFIESRVPDLGSLALDKEALQDVIAEMQIAHRGAFAILCQRLLSADPDERPTAKELQSTVSPSSNRIKASVTQLVARTCKFFQVVHTPGQCLR